MNKVIMQKYTLLEALFGNHQWVRKRSKCFWIRARNDLSWFKFDADLFFRLNVDKIAEWEDWRD